MSLGVIANDRLGSPEDLRWQLIEIGLRNWRMLRSIAMLVDDPPLFLVIIHFHHAQGSFRGTPKRFGVTRARGRWLGRFRKEAMRVA